MKEREWLNRSLEQSDPISSFSNSWRAFNGLFYSASGSSEKQKITEYIFSVVSEVDAKDLIDTHQEEVAYLTSRPVIDMRGHRGRAVRTLTDYSNAPSYLEKLKYLFFIIYQVRCNLEHGQKSPSRNRDIRLCECSWPLVAEIVDRNA